ncbi:MAG: hypothetical protein L6R42_008065 [Xanthoria sp. 1 TBL-2021]|nr:MAG: hypothetical protein L6R42_008065 [Xanthoria sp. 1 TBL-2021]
MQVGSRAPSLLRSHSPLLIFLAPSIASVLPTAATWSCSRHLVITGTTRHRRAIRNQQALRQASSAAAQQSLDDDRPQSNDQPLLKPQRQSSTDVKKRQMSLLEKFRDPARNIQAPMSEEDRAREIDYLLDKGRDQSTTDPNRSATSDTYNGESSADMVERLRAESRRKDYAAAENKKFRQGSLARGMKMPPRLPESKQQDILHIQEATRAVATIKSRPSLGRTVEVMPERGLDLGRALRSLEINCAVNNVRGDAQTQRFHERPGMKRKRLHSLRWRRRFKIGFKAVVGKVKAMRRKGW